MMFDGIRHRSTTCDETMGTPVLNSGIEGKLIEARRHFHLGLIALQAAHVDTTEELEVPWLQRNIDDVRRIIDEVDWAIYELANSR
jgi:hypothetical protein